MTREELLILVNGKVDTSKFKSLSQKTISEELDDALEDIGDDDAENDRVVTKLANRLKRIDGNLHKNVSDEIRKSRDKAKREKKEDETEDPEGNGGSEDSDPKYAALEKKINELIEANERRDKAAAKKAAIESVRSGMREKFNKANLDMNDFFLETALSKLEVPDRDVDINELVSKAESIYTSDYRRATGSKAIPSKGQASPSGEGEKTSDHEWDDIIERRKRRFGNVDKKK